MGFLAPGNDPGTYSFKVNRSGVTSTAAYNANQGAIYTGSSYRQEGYGANMNDVGSQRMQQNTKKCSKWVVQIDIKVVINKIEYE